MSACDNSFPEQWASSCSLFAQVPAAGSEALDRAERLKFIKFREVSPEHRLRCLSDWLSGIGPEVLGWAGHWLKSRRPLSLVH